MWSLNMSVHVWGLMCVCVFVFVSECVRAFVGTCVSVCSVCLCVSVCVCVEFNSIILFHKLYKGQTKVLNVKTWYLMLVAHKAVCAHCPAHKLASLPY